MNGGLSRRLFRKVITPTLINKKKQDMQHHKAYFFKSAASK
jgi:hypothetical protein